MRKLAFLVIILVIVAGLAAPAYCDGPVKKLGRGICNVLTCPFEIFEQMSRVHKESGPMAGVTYGLLKGVGMTGVRAVVGAYEVATFPVPVPGDYEPILRDPEFFFQDVGW